MKEYIPVNAPQIGSTRTTHLKVEIYYSLGGINYFTYKNERRGYYISVSPVERREYAPGLMMEGTTCFSGYKALLKEVTRKSAKAEREAEAAAPALREELIRRVMAENHLTFTDAAPEARTA